MLGAFTFASTGAYGENGKWRNSNYCLKRINENKTYPGYLNSANRTLAFGCSLIAGNNIRSIV